MTEELLAKNTTTTIDTIETTRRCARAHAGTRRLDATSKHGRHYREVVDARHRFPSMTPGVEIAGAA